MVNEWTRGDLPDATELCRMSAYNIDVMVDRNLNAIVDHLNANHQKPEPGRWRRAHAIVEAERDTARESLRESYGLARSLNMEAHQATKRAEAAERERDEAVARAEAAEARTAVTREDVEKAIRSRPWKTNGVDGQGYEIIHIESAVAAVCNLFGIEAEPADPVEAKAREIAKGIGWDWDVLDDEYVDIMRSVSVHVLGQEAKR